MSKSRDKTEFDNLQALIDFKNSWANGAFSLAAPGQGLHFHAQVAYESANRSVTDLTNVRAYLTGYKETGQIDIDETDRMPVDQYHLRISRSFGEYVFDANSGQLIITNESAKMGGPFEIRILPIGGPR